jgi:hypothetical protein
VVTYSCGVFKIGGKVTSTVKYADDLVLLAKEGAVDRVMKLENAGGMEMNVEKTKVRRISVQLPTVQIVEDQQEVENVEYFSYLDSLITNVARCICEIKCRFAMGKAAVNKKKAVFTSKFDLNLRKRLQKFYIGIIAFCMVLKLGHIGK